MNREDDLGLQIVKLLHKGGLLGAAARVTIHGGGSGVFDFGIGHHTYGALTDTAQNFSNIFLAGIIEGIFRAVTVHAERVNALLMARHVSGSGVG